MSVIFVVTPLVVAGGWPVLAAAAAAAAGTMGLKALKGEQKAHAASKGRAVSLEVENVEKLAGGVRADDKMTFGNDRIRITLARDARGKCTVHVDGEGTEEELRQAGTTFLHKAMQQYAYHKVASELQKKGFQVVKEEVTGKQAIRIQFRKFE